MGCCDACLKYLFFGFNAVFSISGLAIIIVGAISLSAVSDYKEILTDIDSSLTAPQITLIVAGVIIFGIATLGCCGAIRESRFMLLTYAALLFVIFITELGIGIYAVALFSNLKTSINDGLEKKFEHYGQDEKLTKMFDALQKQVKCCGVHGPQDYDNILQTKIPDSCCKDYSKNCAASQVSENFWTEGCTDELTYYIHETGKMLGGVAIALSFIELIGVIFAVRLAFKIRAV